MRRRARGEGSLYFDSHRGRWVGAVDTGISPKTGRRRRVKVVGREGESRSSVAARLRRRGDELEASSPSGPDTVGDLVELWLRRSAPKTKAESTMSMVESLVSNHVLPVLGDTRLATVTVEHIESFLDARASTHSKSTLTKLRAILAQSFDLGVRRRHVTWNPARAAELPPDATTTREPRALSASEARALLNVAENHRLGVWVTVALTLGLRPGEVSGLTWEATDSEKGTATIFQALGRSAGRPVLKPTKTKNTRTLALPPITMDALSRHRRQTAEERLLMGHRWPLRWASLVFVTEEGTPLDSANVRRLISRLAAEAGISGTVTPYDLRHTATTLIAASGLSADRLADLLGHVDTRMVWAHYRHRQGMVVDTAVAFWGSK